MDAAQKSEEKTAAAGRNDVVIAGQWHRLLTQWRGLAALEPEALVRAVGAARLGEEIPPVLEVLQRLLAAALDPWPALITVWWDAYGEQEIGTPEALALIVEHGLTWDWGEAPDERRRRVALGKALAARQGTIIGEHQICRSARKRHNSQLWSLRAMGRDMP
jgi:hypothetical protein